MPNNHTELLETLYSHPNDLCREQSKTIITHTNGVKNKALFKYKGPKDLKQYLELICIFHDVGKLNPNFQDYLFTKTSTKYKNHSYLSAISLFYFIYKYTDQIQKNYCVKILGFCIVLILKHHGNLPDIQGTRKIISDSEIYNLKNFLLKDKIEAKEYIKNLNLFLKVYFPKINAISYTDFLNFFDNIESFFRQIKEIPDTTYIKTDKLRYFLISKYLFSCLIEADKKDAANYEYFEHVKEVKIFNHRYITKKLEDHYQKFKTQKTSKTIKSLNNLRTTIKDTCVKNTKKYVKEDERLFQIIAPTGSGKTLTFLNVANSIKGELKDENLKIIYAIPYLSITDQITKECENIFNDQKELIKRIDSSAIESESREPNDFLIRQEIENARKEFSHNTFDAGFIITTFVKLFETLTSNKNKTLLRYNNFANSIIIIDEIQTLPPRCYTFFVAVLSKYAKLFNSYIVIGSATVPLFEIPEKNLEIQELFKDYKPPINLLDNYKEVYKNSNFCRYKLTYRESLNNLALLTQEILESKTSTLAILNTRKASLELYENLSKIHKNTYLLNTNQTLEDRRKKLNIIKKKLREGQHVYLISTQLIEAGVDISFPKVYRDISPFPSIIQTAGRCNRNREIGTGEVIICKLKNENNIEYYKYVYSDLMEFTEFILRKLPKKIAENDLLQYQDEFFKLVKDHLEFGKYDFDNEPKTYLQDLVKEFKFAKLGEFKLIRNNEFKTKSVFIIVTKKDQEDWDKLIAFSKVLQNSSDKNNIANIKKYIRYLSSRILSISDIQIHKCGLYSIIEQNTVFGISCLDLSGDYNFTMEYSFDKGLVMKTDGINII